MALSTEVGMGDIKDNRGRWISPGDAVWTVSVYMKTWGVYAGYNKIIIWDREQDLIKKVPLEKAFGRLTVISDQYPVIDELSRLKAANELVGENGTEHFKDFMAWIYTQKTYLVCVPFVKWIPVFIKGAVICENFLRLRPVLMNPNPAEMHCQHGRPAESISSADDYDDGGGGGGGYDDDDDDIEVIYDGTRQQPNSQEGGFSQTICSNDEIYEHKNKTEPYESNNENHHKSSKDQLVEERTAVARFLKTVTDKNNSNNTKRNYKPMYMDRLHLLHEVPWSAWFKQSQK